MNSSHLIIRCWALVSRYDRRGDPAPPCRHPRSDTHARLHASGARCGKRRLFLRTIWCDFIKWIILMLSVIQAPSNPDFRTQRTRSLTSTSSPRLLPRRRPFDLLTWWSAMPPIRSACMSRLIQDSAVLVSRCVLSGGYACLLNCAWDSLNL